jgi:hypothetical protein
MTREGPPLDVLMRRLVETPPEFLAEPLIGRTGEVDVAAVVWDVLRDMQSDPLPLEALDSFRPTGWRSKSQRNRLLLVLLGCWLLADPWFRDRRELARRASAFLSDSVGRLEEYLKADRLLHDSDRREELIRSLLSDLDLRPAGETEQQAADRLQTLDTAERQRVLQAAAKAEARAREIREAMARAAAQESANRYGE